MNVQPIQGNQSTPGASKASTQMKALDAQITELQKRIQETRSNDKMDATTKAEKIKEYQQQIALIQQQKAQIQAEERKAQRESSASSAAAAAPSKEAEVEAANADLQNAFVLLDSARQSHQALGSVRAQLEGELRIAIPTLICGPPTPKPPQKPAKS